ncbi:MAG: ABC transporter permease [Planctomycetota bacterium]
MILQVVRIGLQRLRHNKVEMLLAIVVPVVFFTIFALIFDKQLGAGKTKPIRLTAVDLDGGDLSRRLMEGVTENALVLYEPVAERYGADDPAGGLDAAHGKLLRGEAAIFLVAPEGWADSLAADQPLPLRLVADSSDPVAPRMIESLVRQVAGQVAAAAALERTRAPGGPAGDRPGAPPPNARSGDGGIAASPPSPRVEIVRRPVTDTPQPPDADAANTPTADSRAADAAAAGAPMARAPAVQMIDLFSENKANPVVSMYAAGIAVMFLLFSATGNAGSLLDEEENQTLERLMCSRLGMTQLILGKWLLLVLVGVVQVTVMFVWAQLVFGVDLLGHVPGFTLMTLATVAAAASLALTLAAACRSRGQLNAVSVILILTMSALGGSMVPRYLMSESMQQAGRFTFNAWAIDGYNKIFWRDQPPTELAPELMVLGGSALVLLLLARLLAVRWETA